MNRFGKLLFAAILSACILAYSNLFKTPLVIEYCSNNGTSSSGPEDVGESLAVCRGERLKQCVPPLMRFKQLYRTAKDNNLAACVIEKSFSTFLTAIMCFLHDSKTFLESNRTLSSDIYGERLCKDKNEFTELKKIANWQKMSVFAVVRNPIDRFVSGFADKCLREQVWKKFKRRCAGCTTNITCFVDKMYERMQRFARSPYKGIDFDDSHFFPQSWRCEFSSQLTRYQILQLDSSQFFDELLGLLSGRGVDGPAIDFINGSLHQRTPHTTQDSEERNEVEKTVMSNAGLLTKIVRMYYFDFLLFGYKLPVIPD